MIEELVDFIISKDLIRIGDPVSLARLYKELVSKDWFMTLLDVKEYIETKERMLADYEDELSWERKALVNIAKAGFFSSDRTIREYNDDILASVGRMQQERKAAMRENRNFNARFPPSVRTGSGGARA